MRNAAHPDILNAAGDTVISNVEGIVVVITGASGGTG
jgi:hypothetical protein